MQGPAGAGGAAGREGRVGRRRPGRRTGSPACADVGSERGCGQAIALEIGAPRCRSGRAMSAGRRASRRGRRRARRMDWGGGRLAAQARVVRIRPRLAACAACVLARRDRAALCVVSRHWSLVIRDSRRVRAAGGRRPPCAGSSACVRCIARAARRSGRTPSDRDGCADTPRRRARKAPRCHHRCRVRRPPPPSVASADAPHAHLPNGSWHGIRRSASSAIRLGVVATSPVRLAASQVSIRSRIARLSSLVSFAPSAWRVRFHCARRTSRTSLRRTRFAARSGIGFFLHGPHSPDVLQS